MADTDPTMEAVPDSLTATGAGRTLVRGATRSLLVTPWFAASMGVVIAAALWIHAPDTLLRIPNSGPQIQPCTSADCYTGGEAATSSPGQAIKDPPSTGRHHGAWKRRRRGAADRIEFTYALRQHGDRFQEVITLSGRDLPAKWALTFEIVKTRITGVSGTHWQLWASDNGGKASPNRSPELGPGRHSDAVTFVVYGLGRATSPVSCTFDGNQCSFSPAPVGGRVGWHGQGGRHGRGDHHGRGDYQTSGTYQTSGAYPISGDYRANGGHHPHFADHGPRHHHYGRGGWHGSGWSQPRP
jgi:hypothetical protein